MTPPTDDPDDTALEELLAPEHATPRAGGLSPSPYSFQFTGEDWLRLTCHNSVVGVTVSINYRVQRLGELAHASRHTFTPAPDRLASVAEFTIGTGYLLNVSVYASSGAPRVGQTFVRLQVIRGRGGAAIVLGTIVQGYLTAEQDLGWPGSELTDSIRAGGTMRVVHGTTPAPGSPVVETVPLGARWQIQAFHVTLTTSGDEADREPYLQYFSDGGLVNVSLQLTPIPKFMSRSLCWANGVQPQTGKHFPGLVAALPLDLQLPYSSSIAILAMNLSPTDTFGQPTFVLREWLEAQ